MPDFVARLAAAFPTVPQHRRQARLRRWIKAITGRTIHQTTTSRYASGVHRTTPEMDALLAVIEKPELIEELRR